ncbi:FAD-dependent oxidoreductase [Streptosporangium sp. H16]|uniref:FAD-dependent oxidoreductase n=1 Tax=Streptosporangium sp. H16 TaxID=3444184 RepID=UPI003F7A88DE
MENPAVEHDEAARREKPPMNTPGRIETEIAVIGAGLTGSATAWELARRGHAVTLIEAYDVGHWRGSSHGTSRIHRRAYADPEYVRLTGLAGERWRELENDTGTALLRVTGGSWPAVKVAQHDAGKPVTAITRDGVVDPASRAVVTAHVRRWLPGLDPAPAAEASCLYTFLTKQLGERTKNLISRRLR